MSIIRRYPLSISLSTLGAGTGRTSALSGQVGEIYTKINKAAGANVSVIMTSTSFATAKSILTIKNPSTVGVFYYPRALACGTTANALSSSESRAIVPIPLNNEKVKVVVASSSAFSAKVVDVTVTLL